MNVDLDAIAQRGHCEVSSLRLALPLIEQGYTPPFLARYRRDELGGLDEASLWALSHAVRSQQRLDEYRDQLNAAWQVTQLADPALGRAISGAKSRRLLDRLSRRIKSEASESGSLAQRLAVRLLSPEKGDGEDLEAIAASLIEASAKAPPRADATEVSAETSESTESSPAVTPTTDTVLAKLDDALAKRLSGDPRIMGAAVRWLSRNAKIHVVEVTDPHGGEDDEEVKASAKSKKAAKKRKKGKSQPSEAVAVATAPAADTQAENSSAEGSSAESPSVDGSSAEDSGVAGVDASAVRDANATDPGAVAANVDAVAPETPAVAEDAPHGEATLSADAPATASASPAESASSAPPAPAVSADVTPAVTSDEAAQSSVADVETQPAAPVAEADAPATDTNAEPVAPAENSASEIPAIPSGFGTPKTNTEGAESASEQSVPAKPAKKKKVSPRQRRRRWLVSTLKPLAGKRMPAAKLSAFQIVMLGRALRSQVAQCAFDYDAAQLVAEMQKAATNLNRHFGDHLAGIVVANEAALRDAAEGAWWDEIQEQASARLVSIAADNLHSQINRGGVSAKVVMSIDAVGPRTAATSIVAADGRVLHNEDIPCQLSAAMRTLAVTKIGELIHQHHVDLIVISNGPARRACMIAIGELIKQSAEHSIRWTLADRSGADAYAGSAAGDQEMKSTPRRFRAAAWIAFATLQPSQAMVKVDPLKLRLGSFQRELSDQAILDALEDVLVSGAARGGVDVNSTTPSWLERLPGMTRRTADAIDAQRREKLIGSRDDLLARADWPSAIHTRQALPFLRVFSSEETLDGTLIHPDDYPLAKRLAKALDIELPPASPSGYELPDYSTPAPSEAPATADAVSDEESTADESAEETSSFGPAETTESDTADAVLSNGDAAAEASDSPATEGEAASEVTASAEGESSAASEVAESSDDPAATVAAAQSDSESEPSAEEPATPAPAETFRQTKPERAKVEKLIKEWQVGVHRSLQIVSWLCEPFGEGTVSGPSPAVMNSMPALSDLKQGDQVIGVVVGVMPFGVFVELTPECSGLIHVSRVSDGFVEDLHEAVQVGDVVTAWVTGIDSKRRRVGLSAISPEREAELQSHRHDARGRGRGPAGGQGGQRGGARGGAAAGGRESAGASRGRGGSAAGTANAGPGGRSSGPGERNSATGGGQRRDNRGGGGRDGNRGRSGGGGRRDQRGGGRGPRRPEVYEVVGKETDSAPLTEAMQKGKEPLRSFGDLMQFVTKDKAPAEKPKAPPEKPVEPAPAAAVDSEPAKAEAKPESVADAAVVSSSDAASGSAPVDSAPSAGAGEAAEKTAANASEGAAE
ncbi:S1 RNA-binding domain-containing protein [Allorhodopirellula heiligendammensis]|uniref:General stress protein 13 n=1 Tax=Allorhodopirellula heiligendammensis TaxID=2714739 RepID=A0A5C6BWV9_9BACT|nr:S1 RNA-binding domain-containing protein [Allorhodopirellula heiligendammensis]TWU16322.1 General stress protein 13 [Allorhodopirellula heiligendammensis]